MRLALYPITLASVLLAWALFVPDFIALYSSRWPEALTMVLGAFVAGSTPLGGGAVAFPALTKILSYSASDAKMFSVMIQSVGMSCASILFISLKRKIYWREICLGLVASLLIPNLLLQFMPINDVFSATVFSFFEIVALMIIVASNTHTHDKILPGNIFTLLSFTLIGGLLTVTIGSGADLMLFIYLVLIRKENPIAAIPSTVIFMTCNALGSVASLQLAGEIHHEVYLSWLAAVPVVAIAAPLGGYIIGKAHPEYVLRFIISLIIFDLASSLFIGQLHWISKLIICVGFIGFLYYIFSGRRSIYHD